MSKNPVQEAFGKRVAEIRRLCGLTQEQVAERSGVGTQHVSDIERGIKNPSLLTIHGLAKGLAVSPARLIAAPSEQEHEVAAIIAPLSARDRMLATAALRGLAHAMVAIDK